MADSSQVTKSGIATDASTGERYIPSSVRADGSRRREIRVRPGYKPPEDVELYRNKAALAWKNRSQGGVPGTEGLKNDTSDSAAKSGSNTNTTTAASNKNAKRREAKKKAKTEGESGGGGRRNIAELDNWRSFAASNGGDEKKTEDGAQKTAEKTTGKTTGEPPVDPEAENEKRARNLKKKLRQARDLRDKKQQGESLLPEQLDKIIKINELVRQLDSLGFDSNGDKKGADGEGEQEKKESA
jgi:partner of Y14 and mago